MRRVTILLLGLLFVPLAVSGQNWTFDKVFPDSANADRDIHGITVDGEGKLWYQPYYPFTGDSVFVPQTGDSARVTVIQVFNADGTEASISPIKFLTFPDQSVDTVGGYWNGESFAYKTGNGLTTTPDGDIVAAFRNNLYVIDHKTGAGIAKTFGPDNGLDNRGLIKPAVDAAGNVYVSGVFPGDPINIYDNKLTYVGAAIDTSRGFSRGMEVSDDGATIYWPGYTNNALFIYQRPDPFSSFNQVPDTVLKGMAIESIVFHPVTDYLWVSSGSSTNPPNAYPGYASSYTEQTWYAFDYADLMSAERLDSIAWNEDGSGPVEGRPRAIGFSPDGKTAYLGQFSQGAYGLQTHTTDQVFTSTEGRVSSSVPEGFKLEQNYPNPFNPSTTINYSINKSGAVSLKIYDLTGREVANLVNETKSAGDYSVTFDASRLASGVYIYTLQANGFALTNRMTLIK